VVEVEVEVIEEEKDAFYQQVAARGLLEDWAPCTNPFAAIGITRCFAMIHRKL